jgi:ribonucleoside-diphosphate reductase alpha chain
MSGHPNPAIDNLLRERYYARDEEGNLCENSPDEMFNRVATAIAKAEYIFEENPIIAKNKFKEYLGKFYDCLSQGRFMAATPILANAGKDGGCLSSCFVLPLEDSMEDIFDSVKNTALIQKQGGGTGINLSKLREEGSIVGTTGHGSSGPVSFLKVFNAATDVISQGGMRRGASIALLDVSHPDIEQFISCKDVDGQIKNFNLSVSITNKFMETLERDEIWELISPKDGKVTKTLWAKDLWNMIAAHAWKTGEPGIIFMDRAQETYPFVERFLSGCNPCGEQPLEAHSACALTSMNLSYYFKESDHLQFNWYGFINDIHTAMRFLDNMIEVSSYPLPEITRKVHALRQVGLGVIGWADLLIKMKIPYNSEEAIDIIDAIMLVMRRESEAASINLALERGAFPAFNESTFEKPMRNATRLTIAPGGTISRIVGCSSGIEPVFSWFIHHKLSTIEYDEVHWAVNNDDVNWAYNDYIITAPEIPPYWHVRHLAAFQKHIDNAVSKTVNMSFDATVKDVNDILILAS